jgi:hypothetical protein
MGLDEHQGQLGQFAYELFEAAVFLSPLFDLREQIHRDVNGMGFGFELPGEVVARVLVASSAAAVGVPAGAADDDEASGQDGGFGLELLLAGLEAAADQSRITTAPRRCEIQLCHGAGFRKVTSLVLGVLKNPAGGVGFRVAEDQAETRLRGCQNPRSSSP